MFRVPRIGKQSTLRTPAPTTSAHDATVRASGRDRDTSTAGPTEFDNGVSGTSLAEKADVSRSVVSGDVDECRECSEEIGVGAYGCREFGRTVDNCVSSSRGCARSARRCSPAPTRRATRAEDSLWCANTTETLPCEDGATLDTPACRQVTITFAPLFENNHARKCGNFTTARSDRCVANEQACVQMDVECDAYDICFNTTLVNDSCSGNDALTTVSTSLSRAATRLSKAGRGCLVRSNKRDVGCDGTQIMECVERVFVTPNGNCIAVSNVAHCTAASNSMCTQCSFWHRPTRDGTGCEAHAVWWVIHLIILLCAVVIAALVALVVAAVNWAMKRLKQHEQARTVCLCDEAEQHQHHPARRRACRKHALPRV